MINWEDYYGECPDDVCYSCGLKFPADLEVEEGSVEWDGFCSEECKTKEEG